MTHTEMTGATVPGDSGGGERRVLVLSAGGTGGLELPHADFRLQCVSKPLAPPTPAGQVLSTLDGKCSCVAIPHASFQTSSYFQEISEHMSGEHHVISSDAMFAGMMSAQRVATDKKSS